MTTTPTRRHYLDVHVIQSVPPSNLNRDREGRPKSATYGGSTRARVSSQSWKRATRMAFETSDQGIRTKLLGAAVAQVLVAKHNYTQDQADTDAALSLAAAGFGGGKKQNHTPTGKLEYLLLFGPDLAEKMADAVVAGDLVGDDAPAKVKNIIATSDVPLSLGLFGRMVADDKNLSVDAACQVAHTISTHGVTAERDFYTAVDDLNDTDAAAGMLGDIGFNSSTLYRFASINVDDLRRNLCSDSDSAAADREVADGAAAFVKAFSMSTPTGHQNSFAAQTPPSLVLVSLRHDRPMSLVGGFERPVQPGPEGGFIEPSIARLVAEHRGIREMFGPAAAHVLSTRVSGIDGMTEELGASVPIEELYSTVENLVLDAGNG